MTKIKSTENVAQSQSADSGTTARTTGRRKPEKPYPDFPLYAHPRGYWCKKIRGKFFYFGRWEDPDGALAKYLEQKDSLHAGRSLRPDPDALTVKELCNQFLNAKAASRDAGEITSRTWDDYKAAGVILVDHFGRGRLVSDLGPDDFASLRKKMAKNWGPVTLGNTIQRIRVAFKFAVDNGLVSKVIPYGQAFKRPSKKTLRLDKAKNGVKLFTADEVRQLLDAATQPLKAMLLLGINAGLGNSDCGKLPLSALSLETAWLDFPRPKTGIARRCPLWPETVDAVREAIAHRPVSKSEEHAALVFITRYGGSWAKAVADSPITKETQKILKKLGIAGRKGLGFYSLRHTFRTIADEAKDQPAADFIMGHSRDDMSSVYRERIADERLHAVTDHVRQWLFGSN